MSLHLLLVDDHALLRQGLRRLLETRLCGAQVQEARDGRDALRVASGLRLDVVLMDVMMPRLNGIEATARLLAANPELGVIGLSAHADPRFVGPLLRAGARGYVLKDAAIGQLVTAVEEVARGGTYFSPGLTEALLEDGDAACLEPGELSLREREVLQLLAEGFPSSAIARELGISVKTVEAHRRNIKSKLDLGSVAELTKYAVREGLTSLDG